MTEVTLVSVVINATVQLMRLAFPLVVLILAAGWRVLATHAPELSNFAPLMALTFCAAVYFKDKRLWLVPFAALMLR